jgi:hypothetical protein
MTRLVRVLFALQFSSTDSFFSVISTLVSLNPLQIKALSTTYAQQTGKDLLQTLDTKTSGSFNAGLRGLALGPLAYDCELIKKAVAGVG